MTRNIFFKIFFILTQKVLIRLLNDKPQIAKDVNVFTYEKLSIHCVMRSS